VKLPYRLDGAATDDTAPLLLCLHGQGQNEDFFAGLLRGLHDLPWNLVSLRAPFTLEATGGAGFSWYDYDGNQERFQAELRRTDALLRAAVEAIETELGLRPRRRFLLGFSQGGYCGSYVALMNPAVFAGMVISGARVKVEILGQAMRSAAAMGFRALLCHGERDASVTREAAQSSLEGLRAAGIDVALQMFDSGHAIGRGQVTAIRRWLGDAVA
jgi:phospholipase/carboxylesterase